MDRVSATLGLDYLDPDEFEAWRRSRRAHLLGVVAFGAPPPDDRGDYPFVWIDLPALEHETLFEVWTSAQPVVREDQRGIDTARNEDVLFGCVQATDAPLDVSTYRAYCDIFDAIDRLGYGYLLRVWHYFPWINADSDGLERYRRFNVGRHEAFVSRRRKLEECAPAACALGSRGGPLTIYFLASRRPGQPLSNPRQCAPYRYPASYGPRGPVFSRAMLGETGGKTLLFISGTASIVGHETRHAGDPEGQTGEIMKNLQAVAEQARLARAGFPEGDMTIMLKGYVRDPRHLGAVRRHLADAFGDNASVVCLQADICRADLDLEVEAVCLPAPRR